MKGLARSQHRLAMVQRWVLVPLMLVLAGMNGYIALSPEGGWLHWVLVALWLVAAAAWAVASVYAMRAARATGEADAALQRIIDRHAR